jgi:hypothetical protein
LADESITRPCSAPVRFGEPGLFSIVLMNP